VRALIQRVRSAKVEVGSQCVGEIGFGLLTFLGVSQNDTEKDLQWMIDKILNLRIFEDQNKKMNLSLLDAKGEHLLVSQFTLYGDTSQGRRPGFVEAARPEQARILYEKGIALSQSAGVKTAHGVFQAHMQVSLINDGPTTFWVESPR